MRVSIALVALCAALVPALASAGVGQNTEADGAVRTYNTFIDGRPARVTEVALLATGSEGGRDESPSEVRCSKGRLLLASHCPQGMVLTCCEFWAGFIEFTDDLDPPRTDRDGTIWVGSIEVSVAQGAKRLWMRCDNWIPRVHPDGHCESGGDLEGYEVGAYAGLNINFFGPSGDGAATAYLRWVG